MGAASGATRELVQAAVENYLQGLDSERAQIKASGASGGGGGGGRSGGGGSNTLRNELGKALIKQMFAGPSEFEQKLAYLDQAGLSPLALGNAQYQKSLGAKGTFDNSAAQALGGLDIAKFLFG